MDDKFFNVYQDPDRSAAYSKLEFPGTYWLAYRDLPEIIARHVTWKKAIDFGCGAGRSTRFLRGLGFDTIGLDTSESMLARARERDPEGDYRLIRDGEIGDLDGGAYDLVLSAFTFDNIPTLEKKVKLFHSFRLLLARDGRIINLVSSPEIYVHEWASFSTKKFVENKMARCGDKVHIEMLDVEDRRPVEDIFWTDEGYREVFHLAGLDVIAQHSPLGKTTEPYSWVTETSVSPWAIYVLRASWIK